MRCNVDLKVTSLAYMRPITEKYLEKNEKQFAVFFRSGDNL